MGRSNGVRKRATSLACTVCRKRKLKCNGNKPCGTCLRLNTPKECIYSIDKRKDKRKIQNGSKVFLFKNNNVNNGSNSTLENIGQSEDPASHIYKEGTPQFDSDIDISRFGTNDAVIFNNDGWNASLPVDFNFDEFNTETTDFDDFLKLLGDNSPLTEQKGLSYSPTVTSVNGMAKATESEDHALTRSRLIDVLFENELHAVPGISKWHLFELESRYPNLECTEGNSDEKFLLSTVFCLGSLTIRKRELLNHSNIENSPLLSENSISKLTTDAFKYYNVAKKLVPDLLSHPTIDGFCGLVLMANFMTMMISLERQLYLSINALQLAVALNLNDSIKCKEFLESNSDGIGVILLFWNIWCSSCMLATIHGKNPFITLEQITTPLPCEICPRNKTNDLPINFMQIRIKLATLQSKIFQQLYTSSTTNEVPFVDLEKEFEEVSIHITRLKGFPIFEEHLFYRSRVLMLELSCLRAQASFLLYRPYLISGKSLQAVTMAKSIIHEIWSQFTKQFPDNEKERHEHLDWNFCYPLRTASLTLCISCIILLRYKQVVQFLEGTELFEYVLAMEILQDLVQVLPIEQNLIDVVKYPVSPVQLSGDSFVEFWGRILYKTSS
ncbi:CPA_1a_G0047740.mRNA.1.CDS.1 [Saccharomyces cerevisiae]|nr:CPA_1a_G0047740.mRNA.1.CDS.1 [Saccharomyces cerevisiae]CAI4740825.1 CPI_1c_G0046920.mRNA.1.CDS.1 [Saccharomyces cerevisiae]CAI7449579.1 CPI_1c_G0046920.mRNA.1.CDS.1 [Saccharomyces cerevisiae]CAI7451997.1 CPA_1a_G0047740.mRNA.1.CDS.1 [Saccharomyces cerevisiae]